MISLRSKVTQAVLGYFMLHQNAKLYVNEMARRLSVDDGNLTRKLKELETKGILTSELRGKERYYAINPAFPLLHEYKRIILKTVGFEQQLQEIFQRVQGIQKAILFGSYAEDKMDVSSDVDLLVVGDHDTIELQRALANLQKSMDREINLISMSNNEYQKEKKTNPLLKSISEKEKIVLR